MTNQAYPSLNGVEPSWADITTSFTIGSGGASGGPAFVMADIAAIKWARKLEVGKKRGASGGRIIARTTGQTYYEASVQLYRAGLDTVLNALTNQAVAQNFVRGNQVQIGLVAFDILVQHTPPGSSAIYTTKIKGCRWLGEADDMKEGVDPDKVEVNLDPIEIARLIGGKEIVLL
jgi:hypothetical protein